MSNVGGFTWWNIVPALVGGLMSALSAAGMFWLAQRTERKKRELERQRLQAADAYAGLHKLVKTMNFIENLARYFDDQFTEAVQEGRADRQPALIIRPLFGALPAIEDLTAHETWFLTKSDGELLAKIWEIQERARNHVAVTNEYTRYRLEFDAFIETKANIIDRIDGPIVSLKTEGADSKVVELRLGRLNQLLVPLVASLEDDRKAIVSIAEQYIDSARAKFGGDFPTKKLELRPRSGGVS